MCISSQASRHLDQTCAPDPITLVLHVGVPEEIASGGGPPYNPMEYDAFLIMWDVRKRKSSAYFPQSNGRAEATVKTAKRILQDNINSVTRYS